MIISTIKKSFTPVLIVISILLGLNLTASAEDSNMTSEQMFNSYMIYESNISTNNLPTITNPYYSRYDPNKYNNTSNSPSSGTQTNLIQ